MRALPSGLLVATGALNVAFSDSHVPYVQRARRMLAASVVVGSASSPAHCAAWNHGLTLLVATGWAFAAGMLVALDQTAADLGTVSLVTLLVFAALPMRPAPGAARGRARKLRRPGADRTLGGVLAVAPVCPGAARARRVVPRPGRFRVDGSNPATEPPPTTAQSTGAQDSLAALDRDHSLEAERYRALLSQAERIRLVCSCSHACAPASPRGPPRPRRSHCSIVSSRSRRSAPRLAGELLADAGPGGARKLLGEARSLAEELRAAPSETAHDARRQMDALAGQLRAALDLVRACPAERRRPLRAPGGGAAPSPALRGTLAILRANLSLQSAACRHAIRLAVCVAIGEALGQSLGLTRAYWAPMTVAIVLKPDFSATFSRGVLRLAGTFVGILIATALFHLLPLGSGLEVALIGAFTFAARAFGPANYGIAATAITALVVLLVALTGVAPNQVILARGINTALGGAVALLAYAIWPTWERKQIAEALAQLLDGYAVYFHGVHSAYNRAATTSPRDLDRLRLAGRRARSNLEASVDRLSAEPGTTREHMRILGGVLANSHRLTHAFMALEAGLSASPAAAPRPAFHEFAEDVELTLKSLASGLRGSPVNAAALPDLREDHDLLLRADETGAARHTLVNVETDRVVNSLNTLTEDVLALIALH